MYTKKETRLDSSGLGLNISLTIAISGRGTGAFLVIPSGIFQKN